MKVRDLIEQGEWENVPPKQFEDRFEMRNKRYQAIAHQDTILMWKLDAITRVHPNDVIVHAFPDENDQRFHHVDMGEPDEVYHNRTQWFEFKIENAFLFDGEMKTGEHYPDAHEMCYVRKSFPKIALVKNIIDRHNALEKLRGEMWRYPRL